MTPHVMLKVILTFLWFLRTLFFWPFSEEYLKKQRYYSILQTKASDTIYCSKKVSEFCDLFQSWRSDGEFSGLYNTAKGKNSNVEPAHKSCCEETLYDFYCRLYFQILGTVIQQLRFRFSDNRIISSQLSLRLLVFGLKCFLISCPFIIQEYSI